MTVIETERLRLRPLTLDDAPFMVQLLNDPSFLTNIGDKGIRTVDQARQFLLDSHIASYARYGYGHYMVERKEGEPIGTCGLINRTFIGEIDIGFAYLPAYWSQGYATEAAQAVMDHARTRLSIDNVVAVVAPRNDASIRVLRKLGLRFASQIRLAADGEWLHLYR